MNEGLIPNRYARALYRYSRDCGDADTVYAQTCRLADSFLRVDGIASAAENPFLALADKEALLLAAAGAPGDGTLSKFVKLVYAHGREAFFCQISAKCIAPIRASLRSLLPLRRLSRLKPSTKSRLFLNPASTENLSNIKSMSTPILSAVSPSKSTLFSSTLP